MVLLNLYRGLSQLRFFSNHVFNLYAICEIQIEGTPHTQYCDMI